MTTKKMSRRIKQIVIHHSVSPRDQTLEKSVESFNQNHKQRLHTEKNGLGLHIAYHYVIAGDGRYKKTRMRDEIGYHASDLTINKTSIGICLTGNFDVEKPSPQQYESLKKIIGEIQFAYPDTTIHGHHEYASKSCPGTNFDFTKITNIIMQFYEKIYKENFEKLPEDQRVIKDIDGAIKKLKALPEDKMLSELLYLIAIAGQNTIKIINKA